MSGDGATTGDGLAAETLAAMEDTVLYAGSWTVAEILDRAPVVLTEHVPALLAEVRRLTAALDGIRDTVELPATATTTEVVAAVEERAGMLAHAVQSWKARASGMEAAEREIARLRRQMEHATPWQVSEVPTDEEMRALRMRWAFGPEKYQADADSLIAAVIHGREENARLRAIVEGLRERAAAQLRARAACLRSYADSADADDHANDAAHYRAEASEADTCAGIVAATLLSPAPREPAADDVGRDAPGVG